MNTAISTLKKRAPRQVTNKPLVYDALPLICEPDEQWSFVENKKQQNCLWYMIDTKIKK
ncbi:hypothetical protein FJU30_07935 [Affinibrenneria salicis]|uniref:Transposase n=1 Tax=Affinibrenneria salicis TaxID=2590031 RepID=A0A5J5G2S8_9GAMM|nr:hypothetical protein FJU30_07935 [Affinibrenneria salicis]